MVKIQPKVSKKEAVKQNRKMEENDKYVKADEPEADVNAEDTDVEADGVADDLN
jgi:hypothetical protein